MQTHNRHTYFPNARSIAMRNRLHEAREYLKAECRAMHDEEFLDDIELGQCLRDIDDLDGATLLHTARAFRLANT
ncbi:MAG: hypothetical protein FKY71_09965 [Spiribacter salinus]|uniref:Uncharacterized protein n=1 Tax=Spiribacter salinus TaxID=1335746 RepID=A0A540VQZ5_9GAMM|nr:MAG: hypothetical protein FKY71_09965 [Spiribacter salinus]